MNLVVTRMRNYIADTTGNLANASIRRQTGFSLIEVLIALAILAFSLIALINTSGMAARNTALLQDKTIAHWVAMNKMAEVRLSGQFPNIGVKDGKYEMIGQQWRWETKIQETPEKAMRRIEIRVRRMHDPKGTSVAALNGFVAKTGK